MPEEVHSINAHILETSLWRLEETVREVLPAWDAFASGQIAEIRHTQVVLAARVADHLRALADGLTLLRLEGNLGPEE
jgi:hypothetical protein